MCVCVLCADQIGKEAHPFSYWAMFNEKRFDKKCEYINNY